MCAHKFVKLGPASKVRAPYIPVPWNLSLDTYLLQLWGSSKHPFEAMVTCAPHRFTPHAVPLLGHGCQRLATGAAFLTPSRGSSWGRNLQSLTASVMGSRRF
mmetsp:Transcript_58333/g.139054  ORF Transcript_58333/g.139054 Transcript_58333/m.139054 type:complete len:102 (-) Transcript_58333:625-930(-)